MNELTSGTAKGTVLFARPVSLFLNYKPQVSQEAHELVSSGNWSGVAIRGPTARSDIKGIGYRISVDAQDGVMQTWSTTSPCAGQASHHFSEARPSDYRNWS